MKKIILLISLLFLSFGINLGYGINKSNSYSTTENELIKNKNYYENNNLKYSTSTGEVFFNDTFNKFKNYILNFSKNNIISPNNDNIRLNEGYFLYKGRNGNYIDTFSMGVPTLSVGSGSNYLNHGFYLFGQSGYPVIKSFFTTNKKEDIKKSLEGMDTNNNPKYLGYVVLGNIDNFRNYSDMSNSVKGYINSINYDKRIQIIENLNENGKATITTPQGKSFSIIGFQENPLYSENTDNNFKDDPVLDLKHKERYKKQNGQYKLDKKTIYNEDGYSYYENYQGIDVENSSIEDLFSNENNDLWGNITNYFIGNLKSYITTNGYSNDENFLYKRENFNINKKIYFGYAGYITDLYEGYNGVDSYKNKNYKINLHFGITTNNNTNFIMPTFLGNFTENFLNNANSLLTDYTFSNFQNQLFDYHYSKNGDYSSVYSTDNSNFNILEENLYSHDIGYLQINSKLNPKKNNNDNIFYSYLDYIPKDTRINILKGNNNNYSKHYLGILNLKNDINNTECLMGNGEDNYLNNNNNFINSNIDFQNGNCEGFNSLQSNSNKYIYENNKLVRNGKILFQNYINNLNDFNKENIAIGINIPHILPTQMRDSKNSITYIPNKKYTLSNKEKDINIDNTIGSNEKFYIDNNISKLTGYSFIINNDINEILSVDRNGELNINTLQSPSELNISNKEIRNSIALFIVNSLKYEDLLKDENGDLLINYNNIDIINKLLLNKNNNGLYGSLYFESSNSKRYKLNFKFNSSGIKFQRLKEVNGLKSCDNKNYYNVKYKNKSFSIGIDKCDNNDKINFDNNDLSYTINTKFTKLKGYFSGNNIYKLNKSYDNENMTIYENDDINELIDQEYLDKVTNLTGSAYNFIGLLNGNKPYTLINNIYSRVHIPKKDFLLYPNNEEYKTIYKSVNGNDKVSAEHIRNKSEYTNYISEKLNYTNKEENKISYTVNTKLNKVNKLKKDTDYKVKLQITPNFEEAKEIKYDIINNYGSYIQGVELNCGNKFDISSSSQGELNNVKMIENNSINDCYIQINLRFSNKSQIDNFRIQNLEVNTSITTYKGKNISKTISLTPVNNTVSTPLNDNCSYYFIGDNGNIKANTLSTKYNGIGGYMNFQNPDMNKTIEYVKLTANLKPEDGKDDFEFQVGALPNDYNVSVGKKKYSNIQGATFNEDIIRNRDTYTVLIPYFQGYSEAKKNAQLSQAIQIKENLSKAESRLGSIDLECEYNYTDGTTTTLNDNNNIFQVQGHNNSDYMSVNVYNAENDNDPIYAKQYEYSGGGGVGNCTDYGNYQDRECGDYYAVLEADYFHINSASPDQHRTPLNYQGDSSNPYHNGHGDGRTNGNGVNYNFQTGMDYFPPFDGSQHYGYSLFDTFVSPSEYGNTLYSPNNYGYNYDVHNMGDQCRTYYTDPVNPPIKSSIHSEDTYQGQGFGAYETIRLSGSIKWHTYKNQFGNTTMWGDFWTPAIFGKNGSIDPHSDFTYDFMDNYSKYQKNNLIGQISQDANKLKPKVYLAEEFEGMLRDVRFNWEGSKNPTISEADGTGKNLLKSKEFTIEIKLKTGLSISQMRNNDLFDLIENGENKSLATLQVPMHVGGNYAGLDKNITKSSKSKLFATGGNNYIYEFIQQNQRRVMFDMGMSYRKYVKSVYHEGYLRSEADWNSCTFSCGDGCSYTVECCYEDYQYEDWIEQGDTEYLVGYTDYKSPFKASNNYVVKAYMPSEMLGLLAPAFVKNTPSYMFIPKDISGGREQGKFSEVSFSDNLSTGSNLGGNKKMDYISYLLKTFDFKKNVFNNYSLFNLKDTIESFTNKREIFYYKNSNDLYVEDINDGKVEYEGKKILIVDSDLYINSNIVPKTKNDYLFIVALGDVYINSKANYLNMGTIGYNDFIALDGETTLLYAGPIIVNGKILNYRKSTHAFPDIIFQGSKDKYSFGTSLQRVLKNSFILTNNLRYLNNKIIIKKLFEMRSFGK